MYRRRSSVDRHRRRQSRNAWVRGLSVALSPTFRDRGRHRRAQAVGGETRQPTVDRSCARPPALVGRGGVGQLFVSSGYPGSAASVDVYH